MMSSSRISQEKKTMRVKFTQEEDDRLISLVEQYGVRNWKKISSLMRTRTTRQCRERYINYLSPTVTNGPWTNEEDLLLIQKVKEMGTRWAQISHYFTGRSDVNIKNRYSMLVSKGIAQASTKQKRRGQNRANYSNQHQSNFVKIAQQFPCISAPTKESFQTQTWKLEKQQNTTNLNDMSHFDEPLVQQSAEDPFADFDDEMFNTLGSDPSEWNEALELGLI